MSDNDIHDAGNITFWIVLGPLMVAFLLALRFLISPVAVALFVLIHYVAIYLIFAGIAPDSFGAIIGMLFALWVYSFFVIGAFNMIMSFFQSAEDGALVWAIKNLGIFGQIYYFIQRFFLGIFVFGSMLLGIVSGSISSAEINMGFLLVVVVIQCVIAWVYHSRHHIGVFLDFWGRPRPELLEIHTDSDQALDNLMDRSSD